MVIITGDHRDWGFKDSDISKNAQSRISREKVPLIMIDGVNHNIVWDRVSFSHSSLAVMLEYMMLPTYERNKYQINPFVDTNNELILYQNLNNMNEVIAKYGDREDTVVLDGRDLKGLCLTNMNSNRYWDIYHGLKDSYGYMLPKTGYEGLVT